MIPHNRRITIRHVAREAGVSTQTVSRVINERPDVSPDTRRRILEIIDQLGYQPSALAQSLSRHRSYTLGVVTAGLKFIGPSRTLNGIASKATELGYALLLDELPRFDTEEIKPLIQGLISRHVDGIVWAVPEVGDNRRWIDEISENLHIPVVFLTMDPRAGISTVSVDNYAGGILAVQHLLAQGRRHIGHISGPMEWWEAQERKRAWQDGLRTAGYPVTDNHWVEGNWSSSSGEAAFEQLLRSFPTMDALFAGNDQMALTVLRTAHRRGIGIPHDLAVVGFDNLPESEFFWPALSTIDQNQHELGGRSVQELVSQIEAFQRNENVAPRNTLLSPSLIVRESSLIQ